MQLIESEIQRFIRNKSLNTPDLPPERDKVNLYYRNQMSTQYKTEEGNLRKIIIDNIQPKNNRTLNLVIYYKARKVSNLFITNNVHKDNSVSHVVYQYKCDMDRCQPSNYIGYTETTLKQRMTTHAQNGSIKTHNITEHGRKLKAQQLVSSTEILHRSRDKSELLIAEALLIKEKRPSINNHREGEVRILKIF